MPLCCSFWHSLVRDSPPSPIGCPGIFCTALVSCSAYLLVPFISTSLQTAFGCAAAVCAYLFVARQRFLYVAVMLTRPVAFSVTIHRCLILGVSFLCIALSGHLPSAPIVSLGHFAEHRSVAVGVHRLLALVEFPGCAALMLAVVYYVCSSGWNIFFQCQAGFLFLV